MDPGIVYLHDCDDDPFQVSTVVHHLCGTLDHPVAWTFSCSEVYLQSAKVGKVNHITML